MTIPELRQVAAWLADTNIGLFELRTSEGHIRLRRSPGTSDFVEETVYPDAVVNMAGAVITPEPPALSVVAAPSVGFFLHHHPMRATPLTPLGTTVQAGQAVGLLQIGALLLAVPAPKAGVVANILVAHGSLVGYGKKVMELHPSSASPDTHGGS